MHHTYRIAILEDNSKQLEKLELYLEQIPNAELVLKSRSSDLFLLDFDNARPDIGPELVILVGRAADQRRRQAVTGIVRL